MYNGVTKKLRLFWFLHYFGMLLYAIVTKKILIVQMSGLVFGIILYIRAVSVYNNTRAKDRDLTNPHDLLDKTDSTMRKDICLCNI